MENMIERVARALAAEGDVPEHMWREFVEPATAAIHAMREPTEAMLDAVNAHGIDRFGGETEELYTAMIDAALGHKRD